MKGEQWQQTFVLPAKMQAVEEVPNDIDKEIQAQVLDTTDAKKRKLGDIATAAPKAQQDLQKKSRIS